MPQQTEVKPVAETQTTKSQPPIDPVYASGRWRPELHWWTPIAIIVTAALVITVLSLVIRRLARAAEKKHWPEGTES